MFKQGLLHVYYGDGQGKTCAVVGLAVRACGCGGRVLFVQFLKNGCSGELMALAQFLEQIEILAVTPCAKFTNIMDEQEMAQAAQEQNKAFQDMVDRTKSRRYDLLVLDEVLDATSLNMIDREVLLEFLKNKPVNMEVALTGHAVFPELFEIADYVSEIKKIKHPFDNGVKARRGVEM